VRKFENRVLREILEPKSDEVAKDWGNVYNEKVGDHQVLLGELELADLLMSLWSWNFGCQEKTIKHRIIKFLTGGPGFRLSNQMRNEDTRTRLNVKNVNEIVDNERERERERERNCTHAAYLRRKMELHDQSRITHPKYRRIWMAKDSRIFAFLLEKRPFLGPVKEFPTISLPCSQSSKCVPILIQTTPVSTVSSNLFKSYYPPTYELAFQNSLPWKIYGGFMCSNSALQNVFESFFPINILQATSEVNADKQLPLYIK